MKKAVGFLAVFVACCLAACGAAPGEAYSASSVPAPAALSSPSPDQEKGPDPPVLWMADAHPGMNQIAVDETGAYYFLRWPDGAGAQAVWLNYATMQQAYWGGVTDSGQEETNPGWVAETMSTARPLASAGRFYVLQDGRVPLPRAGWEGFPARLHRMAREGEARKVIELPRDWMVEVNSGVATDGDHLYLLAASYNEVGERITYYLCRTDFEKETIDELLCLDATKRYHLKGVYSGGIVLQESSLEKSYRDLPYDQRQQHYRHRMLLYSLADRTLTPTGFQWNEGEQTNVFGRGTVYYLTGGSRALCRYDLVTGERTHLLDIAAPEIGDGWTVVLWGEDYGGHLSAWASQGEERLLLGIDLATGKSTPVTLSSEEEHPWRVDIMGQTATQFLVRYTVEEPCLAPAPAQGGELAKVDFLERYALIDQDDYWASRPNYRFFEDRIFE